MEPRAGGEQEVAVTRETGGGEARGQRQPAGGVDYPAVEPPHLGRPVHTNADERVAQGGAGQQEDPAKVAVQSVLGYLGSNSQSEQYGDNSTCLPPPLLTGNLAGKASMLPLAAPTNMVARALAGAPQVSSPAPCLQAVE